MNRKLNIYILLTLALCLFVTKASAYNVVDEIVGFVLDKRQNNSTSTSTSIPPITSTTTTSTTSIESTRTSTTTAPSTTTTSTTASSRSSSNTRSTTESTTSAPNTSATTEIRTRTFTTVTRTVSGRVETSVGVTSEPTVFTPKPTSDESNSGGSGISKGTRNTIIGVVVGIGGAIIIGALIIVAFRLRKKKSNAGGYPEDIAGAGSPSTGTSSRPQDAFKATLDQYHKPQGTVNPSANF